MLKPASHYSQIPQTERPMETFPQPRTIPEAWNMTNLNDDTTTGSDFSNTADNVKETGSEKWENH